MKINTIRIVGPQKSTGGGFKRVQIITGDGDGDMVELSWVMVGPTVKGVRTTYGHPQAWFDLSMSVPGLLASIDDNDPEQTAETWRALVGTS